MSDLVEFLRARLDEDAEVALACKYKAWEWSGTEVITLAHPVARPIADSKFRGDPLAEADAEHIARHDPARVLREVEAKRRILDWLDQLKGAMDWWSAPDLGEFRKLMALPYADHPDYREEWRQ